MNKSQYDWGHAGHAESAAKSPAQHQHPGVGRASPVGTGQEAVDWPSEMYPLAQGSWSCSLPLVVALKLTRTQRTNSPCNRQQYWFSVLSTLWGLTICLSLSFCHRLWVASFWIAWKVPVSKLLNNRPDLLGFAMFVLFLLQAKFPLTRIHSNTSTQRESRLSSSTMLWIWFCPFQDDLFHLAGI